jgi:valyl-tRNA synthetase
VPLAARPQLALVGAEETSRRRLEAHRASLLALGGLDQAFPAPSAPGGAASFPVGEVTAALTIAGFIDVAAERARLEKALAKVAVEAERLGAKLANPDFLARAPDAVVSENLQKLEDLKGAQAKLTAALERLRAVG